MHSRIFQLSDEKIKKNNYVRASDFYEDSFIGSVADYVADTDEREYNLKVRHPAIETDEDKYICLICGSKEVKRENGISEKYPDDYLLECKRCGNWEEVGNYKPSVFTKIDW